MKYFIIVLMGIFLFTASPVVKANNNVVKPIREFPSIQETSDKDMISYRKRRRPIIIIRRHRQRTRVIIVPRRRHRPRPHYRRHRGCFIDTISDNNSISSWLLNKKEK